MVTFLNAASLRIIKEMAFTAQPMGAERAERLGMINYVVPTDELEAFTIKLARQMLAKCPLEHFGHERAVENPGRCPPHVSQGFERVQGLRRVVYSSDDYQEGIKAFKEKRKPVYTGK
jgi:methylmalonyl-CoA decarboxylase